MTDSLHESYPAGRECIWVLFDVRDPEEHKRLEVLRAGVAQCSDLVCFGPGYVLLFMFPGAALELR